MTIRRMNTVNMTDVALRAGVSQSTVSRVINNHPGISRRTRQSVLDALRILGYKSEILSLIQPQHEKYEFSVTLLMCPLPEQRDPFALEYFSILADGVRDGLAGENVKFQLRTLRAGTEVPDGAVYVPDIPHAVAYLNETAGNILLTTGSKELSLYKDIRDFTDRVYARVLPMESSLAACRAAGLPPSHIIAMQGPFPKELNIALLRFTEARYLVTKEDGAPGGFADKAAAAEEAGATLVVIGRPPQREGLSLAHTTALLCRRFGLSEAP